MTKRIGGGKLDWIPLGTLKAHPKAQRRFKPAWAEELAANFDPDAIDIITVSRNKRGQDLVVDGQHRVAAALKFVDGDGTQQVLCRVFDGDDDATAALRFLKGNHKLGVGTLDKFMVSIEARDATALGVVTILDRYGLAIDYNRRDGAVQAVDALKSTFARQRGAMLLDAVIRTLNEAWGKNPDAYSGQLIRGVALAFVKWGEVIDGDVLARKLAKTGTPIDWIGRARSLAGAMGISIAQAIAECVRNEYNKGRRTDRLGDAESAA